MTTTAQLRNLAAASNDGVLRGPAMAAADAIDRLHAEARREKATRQEIAFALRAWVKDMKASMKGDRSEWTRGQRRILSLVSEISNHVYDGDVAAIARVGE